LGKNVQRIEQQKETLQHQANQIQSHVHEDEQAAVVFQPELLLAQTVVVLVSAEIVNQQSFVQPPSLKNVQRIEQQKETLQHQANQIQSHVHEDEQGELEHLS
jgi:chromosome segregation protein